MMRVFLAILFLCGASPVLAQKKLRYEINAGEYISEVVTSGEAYRYNTFKTATLMLTTGQAASSKVNYHALFDEMHYIASNGDTLAIAKETPVNYLAVEADTFYYNKGFVRLLAANKNIKLVETEKILLAEKLKSTGAYGTTSTAAIESLYGVANSRLFKTLIANEKMVFAREFRFYFLDKRNQLIPASKASLLKIYAHKKNELEQYLASGSVNFTKEDDLKRLVLFLNDW